MSMDGRDLQTSSGTQAATEVKDTAKQQASQVASSAADSAKHVAGEAATQAKAVAQQAKEQVTTLLDQTRSEVRNTAEQKGQQAAASLRTLSDQLRMLANGQPSQAGQLQHYVQEAQDRVSSFADRLETGGPQALLEDVTRFARRRPGLFLAAAAGAGFAIGRLVRAGAAASSEQGHTASGNGSGNGYGYGDGYPAYGLADVPPTFAPPALSTAGSALTAQTPTDHAAAFPSMPRDPGDTGAGR